MTAFLEIFLYLKNNDSVEHVQKVLYIVLFIFFQGKIKFSHCICANCLFWIFLPSFSFAILLSKMKSLFFSLWKFAKFLQKSRFLQVLYQSSVPLNSSSIIYFGQKQFIKVQIFEIFEARVKIRKIPHANFELASQFLFKFCIILYCHDTYLPCKF